MAGDGETQTQYILPDTLYYMNQRNTSFSQRDRNTLSGKYEIQLDSSSSLKFVFSGYKGRTQSNNIFYSEALNEDADPVNNSNRKTSNDNRESSLNTNIIYRKKFKSIQIMIPGDTSTPLIITIQRQAIFSSATPLTSVNTIAASCLPLTGKPPIPNP